MNTWTMLNTTADIGDTILNVQDNVSDWGVGSVVVIATTGGHTSQSETEVFSISAIDSEGVIITLNDTLQYKHLGISETHGIREV